MFRTALQELGLSESQGDTLGFLDVLFRKAVQWTYTQDYDVLHGFKPDSLTFTAIF